MTDLKEQIDNNQDNKITYAAIIGFIVFAGISIWMNSLSKTVNEVISMQPKMEQMRIDIDDNTQWQKDWQNGGELPVDVEQNERIMTLTEKINDLEDLNLESRITRMETMLSAIYTSTVGKEYKPKR